MSEYELLRAEMMENYTEINNCCSVLYAAVATILAFAVQSDSPLLCLIPYLVIVPLFFLCESKHTKICWIGAYLNVYLEGDNEHHWERRHHIFDTTYVKFSKREWQTSAMYYVVSVVCSFLSIIKIIFREYTPVEKMIYTILHDKTVYSDSTYIKKWILAIIVSVLTAIWLHIMRKNTVQYVKTRGELIDNWQALKDDEERNAVQNSQENENA